MLTQIHCATVYLSLIHLEGKCLKWQENLIALGRGISQLDRKKAHDDVLHENMMAAISRIYQNTLRKLSFRIQVYSDSRFLQQPHIAKQSTRYITGQYSHRYATAPAWRQTLAFDFSKEKTYSMHQK